MRAATWRPARRRLAWAFGIAGAVLLAATSIAFLQIQTAATTPIVAGSSLPGGDAVSVTPVSQTVTISAGQSQQIAGVELYRIAMGNPTLASSLLVDFAWVNPQDASQVLNNPNAWIEVGIYYKSGASPSSCPSGQYLIDDPTDGSLCAIGDSGSRSYAPLTASNADALLIATPGSHTVAYVIASINTPGHVPPGQQGSLTTLEYNVDVQMH